jgi:hypothetical protein
LLVHRLWRLGAVKGVLNIKLFKVWFFMYLKTLKYWANGTFWDLRFYAVRGVLNIKLYKI